MTQTTPTSVSEQHISRDKETIQKWADRHNAVSVRTSSDGSLNLIHESKVAAEHERLDWDTFYAELEDENHAVSYHGDGIEIPEVITQDKAISQSDVDDKQIRNRLVAGETVTNTIHETSAVETPVIEEATVESELVSREIITTSYSTLSLWNGRVPALVSFPLTTSSTAIRLIGSGTSLHLTRQGMRAHNPMVSRAAKHHRHTD